MVATRTVAWVLLVAGLVGFAAAFVLAVEKYWLLTNPFYTPSCSINATMSCGPVMSSPQAAVFGFPNPYLGIAGFAVVAATGAMLLAGGRLAGWYTAGLQVGAVLGTVFVAWLMVQSLTVIHALCPYCMAAWAATFATALVRHPHQPGPDPSPPPRHPRPGRRRGRPQPQRHPGRLAAHRRRARHRHRLAVLTMRTPDTANPRPAHRAGWWRLLLATVLLLGCVRTGRGRRGDPDRQP